MKAYVITIEDNEQSQAVADRCIESGKRFGVEVEKFNAITPINNPVVIAEQKGIPTARFDEVYSRFDNCLSAFLSHYSLWEMCTEQPMIILEHDAVFVSDVPENLKGDIVNLGKPSYGNYNIPRGGMSGESLLVSKRYFPGAHGYYITPEGASRLIDKAKEAAAPTDVFIGNNNFRGLREYYPWPIEAHDSFSTIQVERGCLAKHNFNSNYKIL